MHPGAAATCLYRSGSETPADARPLPRPPGLPGIGVAHHFLRKGILRPFVDFARTLGPCYRLDLPFGQTAVLLSHPDAVTRVLVGNRENYPKGSVYDGARLLLGNGLVTSEGAFWARQRRLSQPAFKQDRLANYVQAMGECTAGLLGQWREDGTKAPLDIHQAMTHLTLDIVGRSLFGLDLRRQSEAAGEAFTHALRGIGTRGPDRLQVPLWLPTPGNIRFGRARRTLDRMVYEIIRRFRAGEARDAGHTLLGALMEAKDADSAERMSDRQLRDEVTTLYLAGHETTANLLSWTFYALHQRPDVIARLREEIDRELPPSLPTLEDLKRLQYARMVLSEVLRLYPPAWTIARNVIEDDEVSGYRVPGGAFVLLSPFISHRLEEYWPHPERFDPERFAPESSTGRHPFAYFPFSAGPRVCIGKHFALYEAMLILGMLLREFRVEVVDHARIGYKAVSTLRPDRPVRVRLTPR